MELEAIADGTGGGGEDDENGGAGNGIPPAKPPLTRFTARSNWIRSGPFVIWRAF